MVANMCVVVWHKRRGRPKRRTEKTTARQRRGREGGSRQAGRQAATESATFFSRDRALRDSGQTKGKRNNFASTLCALLLFTAVLQGRQVCLLGVHGKTEGGWPAFPFSSRDWRIEDFGSSAGVRWQSQRFSDHKSHKFWIFGLEKCSPWPSNPPTHPLLSVCYLLYTCIVVVVHR